MHIDYSLESKQLADYILELFSTHRYYTMVLRMLIHFFHWYIFNFLVKFIINLEM